MVQVLLSLDPDVLGAGEARLALHASGDRRGAIKGALKGLRIAAVLHPRLEAILLLPGDLVYLPPYWPDLNPIELAFSKVQGILRRAEA
jgi:transposase